MEEALGSTLPVFIGMTLVIMGFAAYMIGQAMANTWKPYWHNVVYCALLGGGDRFLHYALFDGSLFSISGYVIDTVVLVAIASFAFRITQARRMASQYPWLYERAGLFGWREKG